MVDPRHAEIGSDGDLTHRGGVESLLHEELGGRLEDGIDGEGLSYSRHVDERAAPSAASGPAAAMRSSVAIHRSLATRRRRTSDSSTRSRSSVLSVAGLTPRSAANARSDLPCTTYKNGSRLPESDRSWSQGRSGH